MAPETRSIASKRNNFSVTEELGRNGELNKRQRRLQSREEPCFGSKACKAGYHSQFISVEIVPGRFVDLDFFNEEGFQFGKWFKDMIWVSVVGMKQKFYPELVRHFYANLSYDAEKIQICSYVKGKEIILNQNTLMKILGIPNLGTEIYDISNWVDEDIGVSRVEALSLILGKPEANEVSKINCCNLKLEMRLLHQMVVHVLLPRKRSFNYVSDLDLLVMWHIVKEKPFNLPFVLLSHMIACIEKKTAYLPYGMILTSIFEHFKVSLEEEESKELKSCHFYNKVTLHKMGYVKCEREWFLKKDKAVAQPMSENQSARNMNVCETHDAFVASSSSNSQQTTSDGETSMAVLNPTSSASPGLHSVLAIEDGRSAEGARQPSVVEGIILIVKGMKEDMSMDSKLDDLQDKIEHLRNLVSQLGTSRQERTVGDIFLLLEVIMGDMRTLRSKMDDFGGKTDYLQSQLIECLTQRQDLVKVEKETIEWMIAETITFGGRNKDVIRRFESIRSEIQDFWDCLSSRIL